MTAARRSGSWLGRGDDAAPAEPTHGGLAPVADPAPEPAERQISTIHLTSFHQARIVGERFRDGIPVVMDLSAMDDAGAKRVVDFTSGLVFGLRGGMDRIAPRVFLVLPPGTELTRATRT